ncbi:hypothetical protein MKX03_019939, partial [Papaver bracteatum]
PVLSSVYICTVIFQPLARRTQCCLLKYLLVQEFLIAVPPTISIQKHNRSQKSWFWHANDFSGGELKEEVFFARFESIE